MKTTTKVFAVIGIILGVCAILGSPASLTWGEVFNSIIGGSIFLAWGIVDLCLLNSLNKKVEG